MTRRNLLTGAAAGGGGAPVPPAPGGDAEASEFRWLPDPEADLSCCRLPLSHMGLALRWRRRFGEDFRWCPTVGWFGWDGRRWALLTGDGDGLPQQVVLSIGRTVWAVRNEAALVAASGYPTEHISKKELAEVEAWAERHGTTSRELYLRGDDDGARARWIESLDPLDELLGKGLWSQKIAAQAKQWQSGGTPRAVMSWIKGFPEIVVDPGVFDTDRMAINVLNGTLRLERRAEKRAPAEVAEGKSEWHVTGWRMKLHPHRREDMITRLAPVKYSSRAACPEYDAFLARVQPVEGLRRFLHQWGGYSLTGDTTEHKLAFFYGTGRNGKGTWVEAVAHAAGDYAGSIGIESLMDSGGKRRGDQATPDLAALPGVRFLRASEPQIGMRFNDGLVKQLSGGDPVKARHLNKEFFEYFPQFKLTISGNTKPNIKDVSHGMWARLQLVPWEVEVPEGEIDHALPDKLKAEASGILNRLIEGLIDWRENGLIVPDEVRDATRAYRDSSDVLGRFLSQCCEVGDDRRAVRARAKELRECFDAWCDATDGPKWNPQGFVKAMEDRGFRKFTSNGMWWGGVRLRAEVTLEGLRAGIIPDMAENPRAPSPSRAGSAMDSGGPPPGKGAGAGGADYGDDAEWGENPGFDPFDPEGL